MRDHRGLIAALSIAVSILPTTPTSAGDSTFYEDSREGWHFYEHPPQDPERKEKRAPPKSAKEPAQPQQSAEAKPKQQGPKPMTAAWIRKRLKKLRDKATTNPTRENVRAYLYLQKVATNKASRFAEVSSEVTVGDPFLDEKARRPTATYAVNQSQRDAAQRTDRTLQRLGQNQDVGILFVFRSSCGYCRIQAPVLKRFSEIHRLPIRAVSLDGQHLPGRPFPDAAKRPALKTRLNIRRTPSTFLVRPPDELTAIAHGVLSLEELKRRTVLVAQREGWISRDTYEATTGVDPVNPDSQVTPPKRDPNLEDPQRMIEYIRRHAQGEL